MRSEGIRGRDPREESRTLTRPGMKQAIEVYREEYRLWRGAR